MVPNPRPGPIALGVVAALALGVIPAATAVPAYPAGSAPSAGTAQRSPGSDAAHTVTLITGDKVTIGTAADGTVIRKFEGAGGATTGYHRAVVDGATYVYPDSVMPYVSSGKLDKRLFNVTQLIADGYDDAHAARLPLIVGYTDAAARSRTTPKVPGAKVVRRLDSMQGAAVAQNREQAPEFWSALTGGKGAASARSAEPAFANGIAKVWLDGKVEADLSESTAQIGAQQVWAEGNTGKDVTVAVLDTGVDTEHPDLAGQIEDSASFVPYETEIADYHGHGTHVASTVAGTGSASDGTERGVAPGARLDIGKVLDNEGRGQESWIIAGMEWAARDQQAKIVSMSLGGAGDHTDPMSAAVDRLSSETGALFIVAAGNDGPTGSILSPGAADAALTVGAVDSADRLADFSSRGPRPGDLGLKPEITAPGVDIVAARSHHRRGGQGYYTTMSGTSMATPHVAGTAALLAAKHPDWSGTRLKEALVSSAKATPGYTAYEAGAGRLDASAAVRASVFATVSAYSGFHAWPPKPGETDVRKVTYTNVGDTPVALDLAIGAPTAPAGTFTLSDERVTVPARGTATVSLTADLERLPADQPISGTVTATDGSGTVRARTLIGGAREGMRQPLTFVAKDRSGKPLSGRVYLISEDIFTVVDLDASGTGTVRLPVGSYSGWITADVRGANGPKSLGMAVLAFNDVELDRARTVTLDARQARQVTARAPRQTTAVAPRLDLLRSYTNSLFSTSMLPNNAYDSIWALPTGKKVTDGTFEFGARFRLEEPELTVGTGTEDYHDPLVKRAAQPLPTGVRTLKAVFADEGAAPARHDVRGKAVVVRRSDTVEISEQARAAAAAGARLLVVVNDGVGRLKPWDEMPWTPQSPAPVTVATLNADQGADLIDRLRRGPVTLKVASSPTTDYAYDVVHHWSGAVPADPTWRVESRDLTKVDVSFRNHRPGKANEYRYDLWHGWQAGNQLTVPAQGERTDWVSAGTEWLESANILGETLQTSIDVVRYPRGKTGESSWFGPIHRPRMGPGSQPVRYLDTMYVAAPGWGDSGAGHVGDAYGNYDVDNRVTLYQGDQELDWGNAEKLTTPGLATERLPYRLVIDNKRGGWTHPYSTHTLTEWNFSSAATGVESAEPLPLIQLDYGVDTDKAGRADRRAGLTVTASHLPGLTAAIGKLSVEVSYNDGATWQRADVDRHGDGWRTGLKAPRSAEFVSLRVTGRDTAGSTVSQTIIRAFGLR
ncbi:S8 family serine peptidase [Streptomyces cadmiisoli]|uniref:Serine protease n=1 Tax=Streptomyces cadmiisoli TaxID=2184053 RepID=A0A2Z4J8K6_9ACTN|nr:S8 family serine peptidase [Streptomyces cadmiisoli]AWW41389.1 serine protease [Streptomyces cadmiisoli]